MLQQKIQTIVTITYAHISLMRMSVLINILLWFYLGSFFANEYTIYLYEILPSGTAFIFAFSFGNILNDIYDKKIDETNRLERPLTNNILSIAQAWNFAYICAITAIIYSLFTNVFIPVILILTLGICYSHPRTSIAKKGFLATLVMIFGYYIIPFWTGYFLFTKNQYVEYKTFLFFISLLTLVTPILLMKDYRDEIGDKLYNKRTPLSILGRQKLFYLIIGTLATANILVCIYLYINMQEKRHYIQIITLMYSLLIVLGAHNTNKLQQLYPLIKLLLFLIFILVIL